MHDIIEVHFVLTTEKQQRYVAEVNLKTRHDFHNCTDTTNDMYTSIASVLDKLERQVRKSKTRTLKRRRSADQSSGRGTRIGGRGRAGVCSNRVPEIIRSDGGGTNPRTVDDAVMEITSSGNSFLLFRNSTTERLNVVYRRKDGNIGWIDPEQ